MTTATNGGMLPLNASYYINDGEDTPIAYLDDVNATSYLATMNNSYYYYVTNGIIKALTATNVDVDLDLYIDGEVIETISLTLNAGNSYIELFDFTQADSLNQYPVSRYGIRVRQTSGLGTQFQVSTTNVFLSPYNLNGDFESEFFSSSNVSKLEIEAGGTPYFGFGGQTNANDIPLVKSVVGNVATITEVVEVYFMVQEEIDLGTDELTLDLWIDDDFKETFTTTGVISAYTPVRFELSSIETIGTDGNIYIRINNNSDTVGVNIFEVGFCGLLLND
jgi:hypothetical protein